MRLKEHKAFRYFIIKIQRPHSASLVSPVGRALVSSLASEGGMAMVVKLDRVLFPQFSETHPGFTHLYRSHISAEDGEYRRCAFLSSVYCLGHYM